MSNPSPDEVTHMIDAIFKRADKLRSDHDLDPPGDLIGFTELLRLTFDRDEAGQQIFASMDEELLSVLYQLYEERRKQTDQ